MMLFAVHISDGVLTAPWLAGGFAAAWVLLWGAWWKLRDEEIPRIALLTSAFFVSSLIHIRVGPTSLHLLLSGLVGVVLGRRAPLAIFVGLLLQVLLIQHGGYWTLGVNTCVMSIPALLSWLAFRLIHQLPWAKEPLARSMFVGVGAVILFASGVYSVTLVCNTSITQLNAETLAIANARLLEPWVLAGAALCAAAAIVLERRLENTPEFPAGFLIGEMSVLLTAALNCVVLLLGGETNWPIAPLFLVIAHLPFAVVEGVILGFAVGFLTRVRPEMLGGAAHHNQSAAAISEPE